MGNSCRACWGNAPSEAPNPVAPSHPRTCNSLFSKQLPMQIKKGTIAGYSLHAPVLALSVEGAALCNILSRADICSRRCTCTCSERGEAGAVQHFLQDGCIDGVVVHYQNERPLTALHPRPHGCILVPTEHRNRASPASSQVPAKTPGPNNTCHQHICLSMTICTGMPLTELEQLERANVGTHGPLQGAFKEVTGS